jgi:hypothetical protein
MTDPWHAPLSPAQTRVPCGEGQHTIRWVAGELELTDHPDAEAELVLAVLGGGKPECVRITEAWQRRVSDIDLLMVLPRSDADELHVTWEDVQAAASSGRTSIAMSGPGAPGLRAALPAGQLPASAPPRIRQMQAAAQEIHARQLDILTVLAMGHEFQKRLVGSIVAGAADGTTPALAAALAGRVAPAIARWLGVNADDVTVAVHKGSGWGSMFAADDAVWVALPVSWLARVWACGLDVVDGRFVVAATATGLLALGEPGAKPVEIGSET